MPGAPIFLIFGEDDTDRRALANLIKAIAPRGARVDVRPIRSPLVLPRETAAKKRRKNVNEIAAFSKGMNTGETPVITVAHRDCDSTEPSHVAISEAIESELRAAGVELPIAAAPAWEIETWWMLFPEAIASHRPCWRKVNYGAAHVGSFENSKERLIRDLRAPAADRARCRDYRESDGIWISENIKNKRDLINNITSRSDSFQMFKAKILDTFK